MTKKPLRKANHASSAAEQVEQVVRFVRGHRVMLDFDLAALYKVETRALNQAVKRNSARFPDDFMFQLTAQEFRHLAEFKTLENDTIQMDNDLKSQLVTSSSHGGVRKLPYAFTEQGIAMLSSVLRSERAVAVNIEIMRAFVKMRKLVNSQAIIKRDIDLLKHQFKDHDEQIKAIFMMIDDIVTKPAQNTKKRKIGFLRDEEE